MPSQRDGYLFACEKKTKPTKNDAKPTKKPAIGPLSRRFTPVAVPKRRNEETVPMKN